MFCVVFFHLMSDIWHVLFCYVFRIFHYVPAEACNGVFRFDGLHQQKPLFKADSGAIIYFNRSHGRDMGDTGARQ